MSIEPGLPVDSGEAWTFVLDLYHPASLSAAAESRITGDKDVVAHLERPGRASVRAMLDAAVERGHVKTATAIGANADDLPVAAVIVMTAGCVEHETWEVPTADSLAWWIDAADFRTVARPRYLAAFPHLGDSCDTDSG